MALGAILFVIALLHEFVLVLRGEEPGYVTAENAESFTE
jgi:hypothetical protein